MYIVIYEFILNDKSEQAFKKSWLAMTKLIYHNQSSLGSRLHKVKEGEFIAYAQWPSQEVFEADHQLPDSATSIRKVMKDTCKQINVLYKMEVSEDYLKDKIFNA